MSPKSLRRFAAALALLALAFAVRATPVAFVTDVKGSVSAEGSARVAFLAEIAAETKLMLGENAALTLMYSASGTEFTLKGPGEFVVGATEVKALKGSAPARRAVSIRPDPVVVARVSQSATASLRMRSVTPPAPVAKPGPIYPRGPVATLNPTLRWAGEPGAGGFTLVVHADDGREIWKGQSARDPQRLPLKLSPGKQYSWTVSTGGAPLGEAHFATLPYEAVAKAEKSRAAAKSFPDRVLHAFVLQDLGATQDAREAWAELARERPDLPELAVLAK